MTPMPASPFISNSVDGSPPSPTDTAVASSDLQPRATAEVIEVSPGVGTSSLPSGESEPSVTLACPPGENLPSMMQGGPQETPASAPSKNPDAGVLAKCNCEYAHCEDFDRPDCRAKAAGLDPWPDGPTNHIHEIFHYVRKLMKQQPRFVLDAEAFMADVEEVPLFLREDGYLQRREA